MREKPTQIRNYTKRPTRRNDQHEETTNTKKRPTRRNDQHERHGQHENTDNLKAQVSAIHRLARPQIFDGVYSDNDMAALLRPDRSSRAPRNANSKVLSCLLLRINP